jgi:hypothetical protein
MSLFGSAHQGGTMGKSQGCKSLRRLVVFVDGWAQPALLTLPPTSIRSLDTYASSLAQRRSAYFAVKTKFTLEAQKSGAGDPYSVAAFAVAGPLNEAEIAAVIEARRVYESMVRSMPIDAAEYDAPANGGLVNPMPPSEPDDLPPFDPVFDEKDASAEHAAQGALVDVPPTKKQRGF